MILQNVFAFSDNITFFIINCKKLSDNGIKLLNSGITKTSDYK